MDRIEFAPAAEGGLGGAAVRIQLSNTGAQTLREGVTLTVSGVENVTGTDFGDWIGGDDGANRLLGGGGNDRLLGGRGNDYLEGGAGADTLEGGRGNDTYVIDASDTVKELAGQGVDTVRLEYRYSPSVDFYEYRIDSNIENVVVRAGNPVHVWGNEGDNVIEGGGEGDVLYGMGGNDTIKVGFGDTSVSGGEGLDTLVLLTMSRESMGSVDLGAGFAEWRDDGFGYSYNIAFDSIENVVGAGGDDYIYGSSGANVIDGGEGRDRLYGYGGDDTILGGDGKDYLYGDSGADTLDGGASNDWLTGGLGADRLTGGASGDIFIFNSITDSQLYGAGRDVILDFSPSGIDKIDLRGIDASTLATGDQAFTLIKTAAFTAGVAGQLRYDVGPNGHLYLYGDVNGDRSADFSILVANTDGLISKDFLL
ncbi:Ca2+-binding RTX toxin-like protein [Methylopila jiangsuensis]|nr:Ca2+-binding RTX toxin-like protein [Methylopila jiangsuensis]